jgi:Protein of unknown function (DUF4232)
VVIRESHPMRASRFKLKLRSLLLPIVIAIMSFTLAACGGSSNSSDTGGHTNTGGSSSTPSSTPSSSTPAKTTTGPRTTASSTTPQQATTTSTSASAGTSTSSNTGGSGLGGGGLSECGVTDLSVKQLSSQGAAGTMIAAYALTNTGSSSCFTYGYPGIGFVLSSGQELGTYPKRVTRDLAGNVGAPKKITLGSGQQASFRITVAQVSSGDGGNCENAAALLITPPNSHPSLKYTLHPGVAVCGSATVTPMLTGTTANPG